MREAIGGVGLDVDDRHGLVAVQKGKEGKLKHMRGRPAHASAQPVSQVWRAGPLRVRLEERDGETWLLVYGFGAGVVRSGVALGFDYEGIVDWVRGRGVVRWELRLTPALDRFLVELVDVIADVRRAAGTVQLGFEDLDVGG